MVFPECGFEWIAVGVKVAMDGDRPVWAEGTAAGEFTETIYDVKICPPKDLVKDHAFFKIIFSFSMFVRMV